MLNIILSILSYDIWFYISHLLLHTKYLYKYIHYKHHTIKNPTFLDTYVGHHLEGVFQGIGMFFPFIWFCYTFYEVAFILLYLNIKGMLRHDHRIIHLVGDHHINHHKYPNYNYGEIWLDWLCGSMKK